MIDNSRQIINRNIHKVIQHNIAHHCNSRGQFLGIQAMPMKKYFMPGRVRKTDSCKYESRKFVKIRIGGNLRR